MRPKPNRLPDRIIPAAQGGVAGVPMRVGVYRWSILFAMMAERRMLDHWISLGEGSTLMRRLIVVVAVILASQAPARAQLFNLVNLDRLNKKLSGEVIDKTQNHGSDNRIFSPILGRPRDLYIYLPPGYNPATAYPLMVFLHGADVDEHDFLDPGDLKEMDGLMAAGIIPPAIVAAPDGTYQGKNRLTSTHSLWVNGLGGRFEDHVVQEVVPYVMNHYSVRPERAAHGLLGISAGGFGAMSIALKHRDVFGCVATLAGPLNMRYYTTEGRYRDNFDPATYVARTDYKENQIIAKFYFGFIRRKVKDFIEPVYGDGPAVIAKIIRDNPADLIESTDLQPGQLQMYVNYAGLDNYNFDAQALSFVYLANLRGVHADVHKVPRGRHNLPYIESQEPAGFYWLGQHLLPPVAR